MILAMAAEKNKAPLPMIPEKFGVRLPPEKFCLTGAQFQLNIPVSRASGLFYIGLLYPSRKAQLFQRKLW